MTIRVLIVDDSAVVRQVLGSLLGSAPGIELLHAVADPILAMDRMRQVWPDVLLIDLEMPRMDGLTFLRKIMTERPTPVVVCSALTERGAQATIEALAAGAVAVVGKPRADVRRFLHANAADLIKTIKSAANANVARLMPFNMGNFAPSAASLLTAPRRSPSGNIDVIAMGTSTGGTQALEAVLTNVPLTCPGIVIVQHMPEKFTAAFAARLNGLCQIRVAEAQHGELLQSGCALVAPGGRHMQLRRLGAGYSVEVFDGPPVNRHRPSVDVLFRSVARSAGEQALGVIMTGMGDDGAAGLAEMRQAGARTLAQDEATCVVFGMPREAVRRGAVDEVLPLPAIAREISAYAQPVPLLAGRLV